MTLTLEFVFTTLANAIVVVDPAYYGIGPQKVNSRQKKIQFSMESPTFFNYSWHGKHPSFDLWASFSDKADIQLTYQTNPLV